MSEHNAEIDAGRVTLTERERAAYGMRASAVTGDALVFMESDVERILTEREAAAWDAGWCAAVSRFTQRQLQPTLNPYRQTRVIPPGGYHRHGDGPVCANATCSWPENRVYPPGKHS